MPGRGVREGGKLVNIERATIHTFNTVDAPGFTPHNLPPWNEKFAGREGELEQLHRRLSASGATANTQVAACGDGGVGKTSLALAYAYLHLQDYPGGVVVIPGDAHSLVSALADLATVLDVDEAQTPAKTAARVRARLQQRPSLLIVDNLSDGGIAATDEWRALPGPPCRRIVTTRLAKVPGVPSFGLGSLGDEDALELLARYRGDVHACRETVLRVVRGLEGWPLALTLVGAYMEEKPLVTWGDYADDLTVRGLTALRETEARAAPQVPDLHKRRIDALLGDMLALLGAAARRALEYTALLPDDRGPEHWLLSLLQEDPELSHAHGPGERDPEAEVLRSLLGRQLLRRTGVDPPRIGLHRVLGAALRERLAVDPGLRDALLDSIVAMARKRGVEASDKTITSHALRGELGPLADLAHVLEHHGRLADATWLSNHVGFSLHRMGRIEDATRLYGRALALGERVHGSQAPQLAALHANLGLILRGKGGYSEARHHLQRAVEIGMANASFNPRGHAIHVSNLGRVLTDLGLYEDALRHQDRALQIADGDGLLHVLSERASALTWLGRLSEAKHDLEQLLTLARLRVPNDNRRIMIAHSKLGLVLTKMKRFEEARTELERAVWLETSNFGSDSLYLAAPLHNLGALLLSMKQYPEARPHLERAVELRERELGREHPETAQSYAMLGRLHAHQGRRQEANEIWRRALRVFEEHLPNTHPIVVNVKDALAGPGKAGRDNRPSRPGPSPAAPPPWSVTAPAPPYTRGRNTSARQHRALPPPTRSTTSRRGATTVPCRSSAARCSDASAAHAPAEMATTGPRPSICSRLPANASPWARVSSTSSRPPAARPSRTRARSSGTTASVTSAANVAPAERTTFVWYGGTPATSARNGAGA